MGWIASVPPEQATGRLREVYRRVAGPGGEVDNILTVQGLRPHTLQGHLALYKAVLHHSANTLPGWLLETVGVYVSLLNGCAYCVDHHAVGLTRELADRAAADAILSALRIAAATGVDVTGALGELNGAYSTTRAGSPSIPRTLDPTTLRRCARQASTTGRYSR